MYEVSLGYPKDLIQKSYIWASFLTSRKRFCKLQEAIWPTVINKIFKSPPRLGRFCQINYLLELSLDYLSYPIQNWCIWQGFKNCVQAPVRVRIGYAKALWRTRENVYVNYFSVKIIPQLENHQYCFTKRFFQYKIEVCSLNPPYFFKWCTKSDCLYFDTTHILS